MINLIGANGIGMAHSIAARNLNIDIDIIIDNNLNLSKLKYENLLWENSWDDIYESADKQIHKITYIVPNEIFKNKLQFLKNDLTIISVPLEFHIYYLELLDKLNYKGKILLEKPVINDENISKYVNAIKNKKILNNVHVSFEWLFHTKIEKLKNETPAYLNLKMGHESSHTEQNYLWDLGVHLSSIYVYLFNQHDVFKKITTINENNKLITNIKYPKGEMTIGYKRMGDGCIIINDIPLEWEYDLFKKQLQSIMNSNNKFDWNFTEKVHRMFNKVGKYE